MFIASETPLTIEPEDAEYLARALCNPGSEMQREFIDAKTDTPMVVAYDPEPIAWVATHLWRGLQTLEGYVDPDWRRKGLARIGALTLISTGYLDRTMAIAVFSDECVALTRSLGFKDVRQFRRNRYGDWEPSPL
jgi:GNAT superfamily N-acetyltransferase